MATEGNTAINPPVASRPHRFKSFMAGMGLGLLGWVLCLGTILLVVILQEEKDIDMERTADRFLIALLWLPGVSWILWRLVKQRTQGLGYVITGMLAGLAVPLLLVLAFILIFGIPHA
ncbi:hypothetical protein SAMN05216570_3366 [Dyella sp. OK004]|uniref:hypothetical protein n=1 Tax=Dyella sp. OK004 TaxID=1855292 RepID=UPI0008E6F00A|nr:hypothetical protein [Dyella sp. OK004]SFS16716.1 hypothetical protein SAMN05216570_3366 [Dyella sp. OK004]